MADSSTILDLLQTSQSSKEVTANALFDALSNGVLFGRRAAGCVALTWGYYGGRFTRADGTIVTVPNGTLTLTANTTHYILEDDGTVSITTVIPSGWPGPLIGNKRACYTVVTGPSSVTSYTDYRTSSSAVGTAVKVPVRDSRNLGIPCDSVTECSAIANTQINLLSSQGGGIIYMVGDDPSKKFFTTGSIWARDKVILVWVNELLFGGNARLGVGGSLDEGTTLFVIRSNSAAGTNVIHCGTGTSDSSHYAVGDLIDIRGQNDTAGIAIDRQLVTITAINSGTNDLTVSPPLEFDLSTNYTGSTAPILPDKTTIARVSSTTLSTLTEGSTTINVGLASLFSPNDVIVIRDNKQCVDVVATSSQNDIHMETNIVRSVDTTANTLTLDLPLVHTYDAAFQPRVLRTIPATHAGHINPVIRYAAQGTSASAHAMLFLYAYQCFCTGLRVLGEPNANLTLALGNVGHGCRISDGCIGNVVYDTIVHRPALFAAGQGYGVSLYSGARANTYKKVQGNGCRHTVLFFKGVADNTVEDVTSIDCRISDIDFHGANETRNTVTTVRAIGGESGTLDSSTKATVKFGNPTHQVGPRGNTVRNVDVENGKDYVVWFLPSTDNLVKGITGTSAKGCLWKFDSGGTTLTMRHNWVEDVKLTGGTKHVEVDGGGSLIVSDCGARNLKVKDAPMTGSSFDLANADRFTLDKCGSINAATGGAPVVSNYIILANTVQHLEVYDFRFDGGNRGVQLTNCTNALIMDPYFTGTFERILINDAGGNSGAKFLGYEATFDPAFVDAGSGSGVIYAPKRLATKKAVSAITLPSTFTGAGNVITVGTGAPAETAGTFVLQTTFKPRIPNGKVTFRAVFPYVSVDATNTVPVTVYWRKTTGPGAWNFAGVAVGRITGGANAGQSILAVDEFVHNLQDLTQTLDVEVRFGSNASTTNVTLNGNFGGKDNPFIELADLVDS